MPLGPITGGEGGGSGTPGLPVWTYTAGAMGAGLMKTNSATANAVNQIDLSTTTKNGGSGGDSFGTYLVTLSANAGSYSAIVITDSAGKSFFYGIGTVSQLTGYMRLTVFQYGADASTLSGDYQVNFVPAGAPTQELVNQLSGTSAVTDGTYTVGIGGTQNGTITVAKGVIISIQEAQP